MNDGITPFVYALSVAAWTLMSIVELWMLKRDWPSGGGRWKAFLVLLFCNYVLLVCLALFSAVAFALLLFLAILVVLPAFAAGKWIVYRAVESVAGGVPPAGRWKAMLVALILQVALLAAHLKLIAPIDPNRSNLTEAIQNHDDSRLKLLLRLSIANAPDLRILMNEAIASDNLPAIEMLIGKGADPTQEYSLRDAKRRSTRWRIVKWKLDGGLNPEKLGIGGHRISEIATGGALAELEYCLKKGYDPRKFPLAIHDGLSYHDLRDPGVMEPDEVLAVRDKVALLLENGADVNGKDEIQLTPIFVLMEKTADYSPVLSLLIQKGADVNARSQEAFSLSSDLAHVFSTGLTPLMMAAYLNKPNYVSTLLKHGADKTLRDATGLSALDYAYKGGASEATTRLLQ